MTLEDLGYKRVEEQGNQIRMRYEKDITLYEIDGLVLPKDKLEYYHKVILIHKEGVVCWETKFMESTFLGFEEMEAILEMRKKGEFSKLK